MAKTKRCPKCKETKPTTDFARDRSKRGGVGTYCADCNRQRVREHREQEAEETWRFIFDALTHDK